MAMQPLLDVFGPLVSALYIHASLILTSSPLEPYHVLYNCGDTSLY